MWEFDDEYFDQEEKGENCKDCRVNIAIGGSLHSHHECYRRHRGSGNPHRRIEMKMIPSVKLKKVKKVNEKAIRAIPRS